MASNDICLKLSAALPKSIAWEEIAQLAPLEMWNSNPEEAAQNALASWNRLDEQDYLDRYPDVKAAGINPVSHFLSRGLNEERFIRLKQSMLFIGNANNTSAQISMKFKNGFYSPKDAEQKVINIAYITDKSYLLPTFVSLYSLYLYHNASIIYDIYIVAVDVQESDAKNIKPLETPNFRINIICKNNEYKNNIYQNKNAHVSNCALYKFSLPDLLPHLENVLFLDGDTLVLNDLASLCDFDMEQFYVAAVASLPITYTEPDFHSKRLGIPLKYYFNSGVMWLNLKKMREDGITRKALEYRENGNNIFMDQDAFNYAMANSAAFLDFSYNTMLHQVISGNNSILLNITENPGRITSSYDYIKYAKILHYSSRRKPWADNPDKYAYIWHSYADALYEKLPSTGSIAYKKEIVEYKYRTYYYSSSEITMLPGYRDFAIADNVSDAKKYINNDFLQYFKGQLPVCLSPEIAPVYVTLTSKPDRLATLYPTLYSLVNQSLRPEAIFLWLAEDEFEGEAQIPQEVTALCEYGVNIRMIPKSMKSYNKLVPALMEFPEKILVVCDDDIFYEKDWLKCIYTAWLKQPGAIFAIRARRVKLSQQGIPLAYNKFDLMCDNATSYDIFGTGVGGVLYPPHSLHPDVTDAEKFMRLAPFADDIWFWAMAVVGGTKTRTVKSYLRKLIYTDIKREQKGDTLWSINGRQGGNTSQFMNVWSAYPALRKTLYSLEK